MISAITLCGRISPAPFGSTLDRAWLEQLRLETDASLIGANTLRQSDPELKGTTIARYANRHRIVISASGNLPHKGKKIFAAPPAPLVFSGEAQKERLSKLLGDSVPVFSLPSVEDGLCLKTLLQVLEQKGVRSLLVEGGGRLNYSCLRQKIVDELYVTLTPLLSGDQSVASLVDGDKPLGNPFMNLELLDFTRKPTGELFLHYRVDKGNLP